MSTERSRVADPEEAIRLAFRTSGYADGWTDAVLADYRAEVREEQGPADTETLEEAAQMYRSLRPVIERTMADPDRWDGDEDEAFHLGRYVEWLAAEREQADAEVLNEEHAKTLRNEATNLRRVVREEIPEGALGTRTGMLKAALILDERADMIQEKSSRTAADATPGFFQPGHTYVQHSDRTPQAVTWRFKVNRVCESPDGIRTALGFLHGENYGAGVWTPHGEMDFDGWTDVTEDGD